MTAPKGQVGIFIPPLGTKLKLTEDWKFTLYNESRNETLRTLHGLETRWLSYRDKQDGVATPPNKKVTIPAGTELIVDRIYIRKGSEEFDSVTFRMPGTKIAGKKVERVAKRFIGYKLDGVVFHDSGSFYNLPWEKRERAEMLYEDHPWIEKIPAKGVRFWAKLEDVNKMWAEVVS